MNLDLTNKVALVAGASQGLGYAIAEELAKEGAQVVIVSRDKQRIENAAATLTKATQGKIYPITADLSNLTAVKQCVDEVIKKFKAIHIAITNVGGPPSKRFVDLTLEDWQAAINLTLMSAIHLSTEVVPVMQQQQWGRIIHLCSASVRNPIPNLMLSNSLRSAVVALGKSQADELGQDGILVNSILTSWFQTDRTQYILEKKAEQTGQTIEAIFDMRKNAIPLKRMGNPNELANVVTFLASERASFVTGTAITVDGGESRFPF